jgi:hypothetical protein
MQGVVARVFDGICLAANPFKVGNQIGIGAVMYSPSGGKKYAALSTIDLKGVPNSKILIDHPGAHCHAEHERKRFM